MCSGLLSSESESVPSSPTSIEVPSWVIGGEMKPPVS